MVGRSYAFTCLEQGCGRKVVFVYRPIKVPTRMKVAESTQAEEPPVVSAYLTCEAGHTYKYFLASGDKQNGRSQS